MLCILDESFFLQSPNNYADINIDIIREIDNRLFGKVITSDKSIELVLGNKCFCSEVVSIFFVLCGGAVFLPDMTEQDMAELVEKTEPKPVSIFPSDGHANNNFFAIIERSSMQERAFRMR